MGCGQGKIRIVGICGSLRGASTNGALLQFLRSLPSDQVQIDIQHVGFLPLFNEDLEKEKSKRSINNLEVPTSVQDIREVVRHADALIFATPEYNGSVSGVLKNAFDWLSRDWSKNGGTTAPVAGKKIGIISASYVSRKQIADVRRMGGYSKCQYPTEDYYVNLGTKGVFNEKGEFVSEEEKKKLQKWYADFVVFVAGDKALPPAQNTAPATTSK